MVRFSVCLPVRNGMPYVKECVWSILSQSNSDFELHILDNQSTDGTVDWLKTLNDPRIRLSFSDRPLSIVESWARIKQLPKAEFMTLVGHDDVFESNFLQTISKLIADYPDAALYQTGGRLIDSNSQTIRSCKPVPLIETATDYLRARFTFKRDVFGTSYVMRSVDYERAGGIPSFEKLFFADDALWLSLLRRSYKVCAPTEHCAVRIHSGSESASLPSAWRSILIGLRQFTNFLNDCIADDSEIQKILDEQGPNFFLAYHRNALIYALVEASQSDRRIAPEVVLQIENSLVYCAPMNARKLWRSSKVSVLRALNAGPARGLIPLLWNLYCQLKNKGR